LGFGWPATHKEKLSQSGFWALLAPPTLAVPKDLLATRSEPEPHQRLGGRRGVVPPELAEPRRVVVPPSAAIPHRD
jgi:hypothetical protein